jgi:hypothetical protein
MPNESKALSATLGGPLSTAPRGNLEREGLRSRIVISMKLTATNEREGVIAFLVAT